MEDARREIIAKAPLEMRLAGLTLAQRLEGMTPDELQVAVALVERQLKAIEKRSARPRPKRRSNSRRS